MKYDIRFLFNIKHYGYMALAYVLPSDHDVKKLNFIDDYNFATMFDIKNQLGKVSDHHFMPLVHIYGTEWPLNAETSFENNWNIKEEDLPGFFLLNPQGEAIKFDDTDITDPLQVHPILLLQWIEKYWNTFDSENMERMVKYYEEKLEEVEKYS